MNIENTSPVEKTKNQETLTGDSLKFQETLNILRTLKNKPDKISTSGPNYVTIDDMSFIEKYFGINKAKQIAVVIDENGKLHFGRTIIGDTKIEEVGNKLMNKTFGTKLKEKPTLKGEEVVSEYLDNNGQKEVIDHIYKISQEAKIKEETKKSIKVQYNKSKVPGVNS